MSLHNNIETLLAGLVFSNLEAASFGPGHAIGDATGLRGSSTAGNLYVSLHTADPGEGGSQNTSEATYTSYARVAVPRSNAGWNGSRYNANTVPFPTATGGSETITHWGIGTSSSGAGLLICSGAFDASLAVSNGVAINIAPQAIGLSFD